MKTIKCDICDKEYKINYYYTHRKHSKTHQKKARTELLLKTNDNDDLTYCSEVTSSTNISKNKKNKKINICINVNEIKSDLIIKIGKNINIKM